MRLSIAPELVDAARRGGPPLETLIEGVWPEAFRIARVILRDRELAQDAAQEACIALARSLPTLRNADVFSTWAYRTIANAALTAARRTPRTQSLESTNLCTESPDRAGLLDLQIALGRLAPVQRAIVLLYYYAGLTSRDIASATGVAPSTVRFHLMVARRTLRKALEIPQCGSTQMNKEPAPHVS